MTQPQEIDRKSVFCQLTLETDCDSPELINFTAAFFASPSDDDEYYTLGHLCGVIARDLLNINLIDLCDAISDDLVNLAAIVNELQCESVDQYTDAILLTQGYVATQFRGANPELLHLYLQQLLHLLQVIDPMTCLLVTTPTPMDLDHINENNGAPTTVTYRHSGKGSVTASRALVAAHQRAGFIHTRSSTPRKPRMWTTADKIYRYKENRHTHGSPKT